MRIMRGGAVLPESARGIMRFHLVYAGQLPSSGNKAKREDVLRIREELEPQIRNLWATHNALQVLEREGAIKNPELGGGIVSMPSRNGGVAGPREMASTGAYTDVSGWIAVGGKEYRPLVRKSLDTTCEISVLFLRQQDPGDLITQGGDIDGRIKTLLDALRMPKTDEQERCPPSADKLYCLLEDDHLVSRLDVDTDRLLFPTTEKPHEVHLVIEISVNVLRVGRHNMCLL